MSELKPDTASHGRLNEMERLLEADMGSVLDWVAERGVPTGDAAAIFNDELHRDYRIWCVGNRLHALAIDAFAAEFDRVRGLPELGGRIKKFGKRYYGIRLADRKVAMLTTRGG